MSMRDKIKELQESQNHLLREFILLRQENAKLRAEMLSTVRLLVKTEIGDVIDLINGALAETILQKEVLIDKGFMTRDEMNEKYRERKEKV